MGNLRFTAAKTSTISKRNLFGSPSKKNKSPIKDLLPSQAKYKQNLKAKHLPSNELGSPKKSSSSDSRLAIDDYNVELDYQLSKKHDIITAIDTIISNQWSEASTINTRYSSKEDVISKSMEHLVFQLKGLAMSTKAEIMKYRTTHIPQGLVTTNQLYSIFDKEGNTFVDRNIELSIRKGQIRKFVITNAAPIIQTSNDQARNGKITYGYENVEVLVKTGVFYSKIQETLSKLTDSFQIKVLQKFEKFTKENPTTLFISTEDSFLESELTTLVELGFITLTSNHKNEIESQQYALSFPNCGTYLKLVNNGRSWLVKTLNKCKFHELLESELFNRWEGIDLNDNSKMSNFRKPFYGFDLNWILADALGAGIIEVFNTPVGRGWKLTGKR
ncbi:hypothetical protein CANTEDRAFT_130046 [Yamadazyma tenuis ATCC 10573]|uniref:Uncharacterized protein n=2 Tax=Candida tenuis TaxID=2315449 RepID=G3B146_CANTC|nr:uncharacterized protein CANTEDRAFT_130046 [Yamadazyma tenuis ATCC 10573]EGV64875.1 hypothetical protein CANTEDRAFT_130046 [Yamadazyma tenuis ATCC 10573]